MTLLDGKIDPNLVNHIPADIRATQIGNTTLGQVLKDVIASINDVLGDIRDNVGDNIGDRLDNIGDGDSLIPTEGNSGSEDAEAILDRIREILNPENKPTPSTTESETETSTTESKKPSESESDDKDDKDTDKPAEPTDKKDEDKKPTKDEAREALAVLERYVNEAEGKDKPADSTDKENESAQPSESKKETESATFSKPTESTSPSKKPGIMDSIFGGGDSEGKSSDGSSNEPVGEPAGDTGVVNPAVNEALADDADTQSGGSAPAGGEEKSAPRDRSQDSVFANRQGSGADESAPQPENKDYNAAAEGSMPVTGASAATKWMLGGAVALILGGLGAIIALRRKEVQ